jgi:peptidoglycan-associated lipoprotein
MTRIPTRLAIVALLLVAAACNKKAPNVPAPQPATPQIFPGTQPVTPARPPAPPPQAPTAPLRDETPVAVGVADPYASMAAEDINKDSPLKPVYFLYDSDELDDAARQTLREDAEVLKRYATWVITVEGHCDERGTAEYNLALGDRRALAARSYLVSLGIAADRLKTVSYGKEFPFDPGHNDSAWSRNRRAHFTVTATSPTRQP